MVLFDQLRISDNGSKMYIDMHINTADYFDDIYLDSITIQTSDKVLESTLSGEPTSDYIYKKVFSGNQKEAHLVVDKGTLDAANTGLSTDGSTADTAFNKVNFSDDLYFVYVKVKGTPDPCTPCELDKEVTIEVVFDETIFYQMIMNFTRDLADDCNIPQGFTDFILLWNAFKAAIATGHWVPAINFYNMLFGSTSSRFGNYLRTIRKCGCR